MNFDDHTIYYFSSIHLMNVKCIVLYMRAHLEVPCKQLASYIVHVPVSQAATC